MSQRADKAYEELRFWDAVQGYTDALRIDPGDVFTNALLYANRAAAYANLLLYAEALGDCDRVSSLSVFGDY